MSSCLVLSEVCVSAWNSFETANPRTRIYKKKWQWANAQFDWGLWAAAQERRCLCVYTKEGTRVPSLNTRGLACTRWTKQGLEGNCLQLGHIRQVDWAAAQHLLSPFSSPFFRVKCTGRQPPPLSSVLYRIIYKRRSVVAAQVLLREKSGA